MKYLTAKQKEALQYIDRFKGIIWQTIRGILSDYHLAEDAYQETVIRFLRYYDRLENSVDIEVMCYLKAIASSTSLTLYKRHYKTQVIDETTENEIEDNAQPIEEIVINHETNRRIYQLILQMDEKYSAPLLMHVCREMPYKEIAKILGISQVSARTRVHRAREKLKIMYFSERGEGHD